MKILFLGDIVGHPGREVLQNNLREIQDKYSIDFTIGNGENSRGGYGIDNTSYNAINAAGVDFFTLGNHTFDNKKVYNLFKEKNNIIRPYNIKNTNAGHGFATVTVNKSKKITIVNLMGQVYSNQNLDSPFEAMEHILSQVKITDSIIIVDFHGDATSEKVCFGHYFDGRISAVLGTHTHIQTADEKILPHGTAYITDVGMTGAYDSCLGMGKREAISRFVGERINPLKPAEGPRQINGAVITFNEKNRAAEIKRISEVFYAF